MANAKVSKRTTLWLGSDDDELEDGYKVGMQGYGFDVNSEDNMVAINGTAEGGDEYVVFIMRDLWPKIRAVMDRIDKRFPGPELLGVRAAARRLGVHENTVRNMAADGRLEQAAKLPGSRYQRFHAEEVERVRALIMNPEEDSR